MKVRRRNSQGGKWEYGESRTFNIVSLGEVIVYFKDYCDSVSIDELEVKLSTGEYKGMTQAFADKDIVPNNLNTSFDVPHSEVEKKQGYNY